MVRRVEPGDGVDGALLHHVALVAEGLEPVNPVVIAGAAHAHAPEGHGEVFDLQYAVVQAGGTRGCFAQHVVNVAF